MVQIGFSISVIISSIRAWHRNILRLKTNIFAPFAWITFGAWMAFWKSLLVWPAQRPWYLLHQTMDLQLQGSRFSTQTFGCSSKVTWRGLMKYLLIKGAAMPSTITLRWSTSSIGPK